MNKKLVRVLSVVLSVVMLFSFAVVAGAKDTKARSKVVVRAEGITKYLDSDYMYISGATSLKEILEEIDLDVVFAEDSDAIISVENEEATEFSKWQVAVDGAIVTADFDEYIINEDSNVVVYNAAEDAVVPQIDDSELASTGVLVFNGIDKNGNSAPISGLKVVWDGKNYTTDKDGKIYLSLEQLEKGDHEVSISKVNSNKVPSVIRLAPETTIEVGEIETGNNGELSTFDEIYNFFYDIFKGIIDVWVFYLTEIGKLLGIVK